MKIEFSRIILFLLCITSISMFGWALYRYIETKKHADTSLVDQLKNNAHEIASSFNGYVKSITKEIQSLADGLTLQTLTPMQTLPLLEEIIKKYAPVCSGGIIIKKNESSNQLHAPFIIKNDNDICKQVSIENYYDVTQSDWYINAFKQPIQWLEPFKSLITGTHIVRFTIPFYSINQQLGIPNPDGLIFIDISLAKLKSFLDTLLYNQNMYYFIFSKGGYFIAHPILSYVTSNISLDERAQLDNLHYLRYVYNQSSARTKSILSFEDANAQQRLIAYEALEGTPWIVTVMQPQGAYETALQLKRLKIIIGILIVCSVFLLLLLLNTIFSYYKIFIWIISGLTVVSLGIIIGYIGYLYYSLPFSYTNPYHTIISDNSVLSQYLMINERIRAQEEDKKTIYIPTNLSITAFNVNTQGMVSLEGYIWQNYNSSIPSSIERNVKIINAHDFSSEVIYSEMKDNEEIKGWSFKATLNESFSYRFYPLDCQQITIILAHPSFTTNCLLTPRFEKHYEKTLEGINSNVKNEELVFKETFFGYLTHYLSVPLNETSVFHSKNFPYLTFTLVTQRKLLYPLIVIFLPIAIILLILWVVLLILSTLLTSPGTLLSLCSAIFFSLIIAHQRLKTILPSNEISYSEYIYFFVYFVIAFVMISGIVVMYKSSEERIQRIIAQCKIWYWPCVFGCIAAITLLFFY